MRPYLDSVVNTLLERTAEELIVGVFLALLLALAAAGIYSIARRSAKDTAILMAVPVLVMNLAAMVLAAAYIRQERRGTDPVASTSGRPPMVRPRLEPGQIRDLAAQAIARQVFEAADVDRDGRLSPAESAAASTGFVEEARTEPGGALDFAALRLSIRKRIGDGEPSPGHHARGSMTSEDGPPIPVPIPVR